MSFSSGSSAAVREIAQKPDVGKQAKHCALVVHFNCKLCYPPQDDEPYTNSSPDSDYDDDDPPKESLKRDINIEKVAQDSCRDNNKR
jgi:hypothetical protein